MAGAPVEDHAILVDGGRIGDIVPANNVPSDAELRRYPGGICFPAFVNMHTHLFWSGHRGLGDDLGLIDWIYDRLVPIFKGLNPKIINEATGLGIKRCYEAGITTVLDSHLDDSVFNAALDAGLRGIFFLEGFGIYSILQNHETNRVRKAISSMLSKSTGEQRVGFSPHAPYTVTPYMLKDAIPWVRTEGLSISTHLLETSDEREYFSTRKGELASKLRKFPRKPDLKYSSPVEYFKKYDVFGPDLFIAHCVDATPDEIEYIAGTGSRVVTCPTSNAKLGCGIAPVTTMLDAGIDVGLGTDSEASCDEFDMFEEMRRLILFQRANKRAITSLGAKAVLEMCTSKAARMAGFEDIGTIEQGKKADLVVATPDPEGISAFRDLYGRLVWGTHKSDIDIVITNGKVVYEKKNSDRR